MQYINKRAFDRGFKDFKIGNLYDPPFEENTWNYREWVRGQNFAYHLFLKRNQVRETYRKQLDG